MKTWQGLRIVSGPTEGDIFINALKSELNQSIRQVVIEKELAVIEKIRSEKKDRMVQARRKVEKTRKRLATCRLHKEQSTMAELFKKAGLV